MKYKTSVTGLLVLVLLLGSGIVFAQEQPASDAEAEAPADEITTYGDYTVKAYSISLYGGLFSGDTFFELPPVASDRTFVEQGTNRVMGYDGEWLPLDPEIWDAPRKTIKSGSTFGITIGVFLSDLFHFDLDFSYSKTKATTTMQNNSDPDDIHRELVDEDPDISVFTGGVSLIYDGRPATFYNMFPYVGFGLGGVINRFSHLEDATGLYLMGVAGLKWEFTEWLSAFGQVNVRTFSMATQEVEYNTQVTYTQFVLGVSFFIDVLPPEVRAAHEAAQN